MPSFSKSLENCIHSALGIANEHQHELTTLEHLLLALVDEPDASQVMRACNVDLEKLRKLVSDFIKNELAEHCQNGQYIHDQVGLGAIKING